MFTVYSLLRIQISKGGTCAVCSGHVLGEEEGHFKGCFEISPTDIKEESGLKLPG
jgi:hypothetical protein